MSSQYNGEPGNESLHASFNISASTNATPIVVTTSAPHDLTEGDAVTVKGHATNTAANGDWQVHIVDASNVALYTSVSSGGLSGASVGNGVGGATGTVQGYGYLPTIQLFVDGPDDLDASHLNPLAIGNADRTQYGLQRIGAFKTILNTSKNANGLSSGGSPPVQYGTALAVDTTWKRQALAGPILLDFFDGGAFPYPHVQNNDIVELDFNVAIVDTTVAGHAAFYMAIACEFFEEGTSPTIAIDGVATSQKIQGSARLINDALVQHLSVHCKFKVTSLPRQQLMQAYIVTRCIAGTNAAYALKDDLLWRMRITRPTGLVV